MTEEQWLTCSDPAPMFDFMEEAGCMESELLDHLRKPATHVRGCWVVDLMLGKA
jgi:hypothetical protein